MKKQIFLVISVNIFVIQIQNTCIFYYECNCDIIKVYHQNYEIL